MNIDFTNKEKMLAYNIDTTLLLNTESGAPRAPPRARVQYVKISSKMRKKATVDQKPGDFL